MIRLVCWQVLLLGAIALAAAEPSGWLSGTGAYRLSYESRAVPVPVNQMHSWVLHLQTADGSPVSGAEILVSGGMPAHDHGLPTAPRVTRELGAGDYLVEGLRFHMNGYWELRFTIAVGETADTVVIPLTL